MALSEKDHNRILNIKTIALHEYGKKNYCRSIYILDKLSLLVPHDE